MSPVAFLEVFRGKHDKKSLKSIYISLYNEALAKMAVVAQWMYCILASEKMQGWVSSAVGVYWGGVVKRFEGLDGRAVSICTR